MIAAADQPDSGIDDEQVAGNVAHDAAGRRGHDGQHGRLDDPICLWRHPQALAQCDRGSAPRAARTGTCRRRIEQIGAARFRRGLRARDDAPEAGGSAMLPHAASRATTRRRRAGADWHGRDRADAARRGERAARAGCRRLRARTLVGRRGRILNAGHPADSPKRVSMPFGAGPRICPGRYLALLEMKVAMRDAAESLRHRGGGHPRRSSCAGAAVVHDDAGGPDDAVARARLTADQPDRAACVQPAVADVCDRPVSRTFLSRQATAGADHAATPARAPVHPRDRRTESARRRRRLEFARSRIGSRGVYTEDTRWRNRAEFPVGREAVAHFCSANGRVSSTTG